MGFLRVHIGEGVTSTGTERFIEAEDLVEWVELEKGSPSPL